MPRIILIIFIFFCSSSIFAGGCDSLFLNIEIFQQIFIPIKSKNDVLEIKIYSRGDEVVVASEAKLSPGIESFEKVPYKPKFIVKSVATDTGFTFEPEASQEIKSNILYLHGSGGGTNPTYYRFAYYLASQGHRVVVYNYFDNIHTGEPQNLLNIDLYPMSKKISDLKQTSPNLPLLIMGSSRGAELSLVLSHLIHWDKNLIKPDAVVSDRPFDRIAPAFFPHHNDAKNWLEGAVYRNPVEKNWRGPSPAPYHTLDEVAWTWKGQKLETFSPIEIEKINSPLLVLHGTDDEFWSIQNIKNLQRRVTHTQYIQSESKAFLPTNEKAQFHIFSGQKHAFDSWAQERRFRLVLDFIGLFYETPLANN